MMNARQGLLSLPSPELQQDLRSVVQSLKAIESSEPLQATLSSEVPYHRFEEVQTLDEVSKTFKGAQLLTPLESLINGGCQPEDMKTAIRLFSAIERSALYHYSDPSWMGSGG